jgi:putative spermidine/putrescine transport system permease protein
MNKPCMGRLASSAKERRRRLGFMLLALPGLLTLTITFVMPMFWLGRVSLGDIGGARSQIAWTLAVYRKVIVDPFYWRVGLNTLVLGTVVSILTIVLAYPLALFLSRSTSRWRGVLGALAVAPMLVSAIVRTYGWMVLLGQHGLINSSLLALGLIHAPLQLSNNSLGAFIALIEIMMPYAILTMLGGFGRLDSRLEEAAASLGANRIRIFTKVVLPLSLPGMLTAALLVFILAVSSFVTPRLIGGGRVFVLSTEVFNEATVTLDWPLAAALSIILLILFGGVLAGYRRMLRVVEY